MVRHFGRINKFRVFDSGLGKAHNLLKLVLEVAGTSLVRIEHCKSQRLVLSVKGNIDKLEGEPVRARGLC